MYCGPVMTERTKRRLTTVAALLSALMGVWELAGPAYKAIVDTRYVHRDTFALFRAEYRDHLRDDSSFQVQIITKLDSANLRLMQMQCGERINRGCR